MARRTPERQEQPLFPSAFARLVLPRRYLAQAFLDSLIWISALGGGTILRLGFEFDRVDQTGVIRLALVAVAVQLLAGLYVGLYIGRWSFGSFEEVAALVRTVATVTVVLAVVDWPVRWVPFRAVFTGALLALLCMAGVRYCWRLLLERRLRPMHATSRVMVFGAGDGGRQIVDAMLRNPLSAYVPVALLDDDPGKQHLRIRGVAVCGGRSELAEIATAYDVDTLLIAVPSGGAELVREVAELGLDAGLSVRVLPPVIELPDATVGLTDIRPVTEADLLGRREIDIDLDSVDYLTGRRVLVTGAGGSIGSELCRQIGRFSPAQLVMLDRDESALHGVQLSIEGRALLDSPNLVVADIRDRDRLEAVFERFEPEVVFHAAALKHLPLLEQHPDEAVKTNVWGTQHVLDLCRVHGVRRFVNISTDKAASPTSALGYSKRITERLTAQAAAAETQAESEGFNVGVYLSVRFGNVLGSRGSVLETFRAQIAGGGPVTVTHPDVTRYFMTVEEAVQLVIQAGAIGEGGEVLVLDMGQPVRILDVARQLVEQVDQSIDITFTGLRPGEKLHEDLFGADEIGMASKHPLITRVAVPSIDPWVAWLVNPSGDHAQLLAELARIATETREVARDEPSWTGSAPA